MKESGMKLSQYLSVPIILETHDVLQPMLSHSLYYPPGVWSVHALNVISIYVFHLHNILLLGKNHSLVEVKLK